METRFYTNWNTLRGDAWTSYYFSILPHLEISYDRNEISDNDNEYKKEIRICFEFLIIRSIVYFSWDIHSGLK